MKLDNLLNYTQPTKYIVSNEFYDYSYKTPVLTAGKTFILGHTDDADGIYKASKTPIILFDDFTTDIKWVDFDFKVKSSACKILTLRKSGSVEDLKYIYYAMMHIKFDASQHMRYWISKYSQCEINYPEKGKRAHVVQSLDLISKIIKKEQSQLTKLEELTKSRFNEMFSAFPKVELSQISQIIMGQSPESTAYNDDGIGLPFFQGKADYGEKYTVVKHYTKKWNKEAKRGYVLMSVRAPVGPVNIASTDCAIGRGLCAMNAKPNKANNEFLYNALNSMQQEIVLSGKDGSTFAAINKDQVYKLLLPQAPIELQNDFSEFVHHVDKLKF
ncbi:MAG: restriction endonuclease subunit S, partial [Bacilli bacterium]|nr:restriction endonuclease subunit S [Bacilli bacterium]